VVGIVMKGGVAQNLTGRTFGLPVVLRRDGSNKSGATWRVRCECGAECVKGGGELRKGNAIACSRYCPARRAPVRNGTPASGYVRHVGEPEPSDGAPYYSRVALEAMGRRFVKAMLDAAAAGLENPPSFEIDQRPCTKSPRSVQRGTPFLPRESVAA
jgi:hypothetical protein